MLKRLLLIAADNKRLERSVSTNKRMRKLVSRFVAGTTLEESIQVTKELNARGIDVSLDLLGETVEDLSESAVATDAYIEAVRAIARECPGATVSVKLSQLGIGLDPAVCAGHLKNLLEAADKVGVLVEIDMEHSSVGSAELEAFREALPQYPNTRVAIQSAMRRTPTDLASFSEVKPRIRLVKGAFLETQDDALQDHDEITAQYLYLTDWALANLPDPAFGTHDDRCIDRVRRSADRLGVDRRDFEFQMLYGVRRDVQQQLAEDGYRIRIYVPYGTQWYPYLMRRMAERPANLIFFLRSLISG
ncbi:MAG TPA: proline dehydrogenase family protein [Microlunatus sp.]